MTCSETPHRPKPHPQTPRQLPKHPQPKLPHRTHSTTCSVTRHRQPKLRQRKLLPQKLPHRTRSMTCSVPRQATHRLLKHLPLRPRQQKLPHRTHSTTCSEIRHPPRRHPQRKHRPRKLPHLIRWTTCSAIRPPVKRSQPRKQPIPWTIFSEAESKPATRRPFKWSPFPSPDRSIRSSRLTCGPGSTTPESTKCRGAWSKSIGTTFVCSRTTVVLAPFLADDFARPTSPMSIRSARKSNCRDCPC